MMIGMVVRSAAWTLCGSVAVAQPADSVVRQARNLFETGSSAAAVALVLENLRPRVRVLDESTQRGASLADLGRRSA